MTGLPRHRANLSRLLRYLAAGLTSLGLCLGPVLLLFVVLEPAADPVEEGGPDDEEPAAAAHADRLTVPLTTAEHAAWVRLIRGLGSPAPSTLPDPAYGPAVPRGTRFRTDEGCV